MTASGHVGDRKHLERMPSTKIAQSLDSRIGREKRVIDPNTENSSTRSKLGHGLKDQQSNKVSKQSKNCHRFTVVSRYFSYVFDTLT
jgi:hypothetical protein